MVETCEASDRVPPLTQSSDQQQQNASAMPYTLMLRIEGSEPRDLLQLEATSLSYVSLSTTLFIMAAAIAFNVKIPLLGDGPWKGISRRVPSSFLLITSYILIALSILTLIVGGVHYYHTIQVYESRHIRIRSTSSVFKQVSVTLVVLFLIAINVGLLYTDYQS